MEIYRVYRSERPTRKVEIFPDNASARCDTGELYYHVKPRAFTIKACFPGLEDAPLFRNADVVVMDDGFKHYRFENVQLGDVLTVFDAIHWDALYTLERIGPGYFVLS